MEKNYSLEWYFTTIEESAKPGSIIQGGGRDQIRETNPEGVGLGVNYAHFLRFAYMRIYIHVHSYKW
jgi:hypothetical protein